ncbi:hypothetical protein V1522DRAFT_410352 [Lipomyces starkeyi]
MGLFLFLCFVAFFGPRALSIVLSMRIQREGFVVVAVFVHCLDKLTRRIPEQLLMPSSNRVDLRSERSDTFRHSRRASRLFSN